MSESDKKVLVEQYKIYVDSALRVTEQRNQTNKYYISLLSGLIAIVGIIFNIESLDSLKMPFVVIAILGIMLCILWFLNIRSYKQLNTAKLEHVMPQIEEHLPIKCYKIEWDFLDKGKNKVKYTKLTWIDSWLPVIFVIPFILLLFYIIPVLL